MTKSKVATKTKINKLPFSIDVENEIEDAYFIYELKESLNYILEEKTLNKYPDIQKKIYEIKQLRNVNN
jgi:hypothetical protein